MKSTDEPPIWDPSDKPASLRAYAEWLHVQAVDLFTQDKEHGHFLFLFDDNGIASMNPVEDPDPKKLLVGVRRAIKKHNLYGVIAISGAWTYFPKTPNDHTSIQLQCNEMTVADLKDGDKTEALMVRMENRDGDNLTWIDPIVRDGLAVSLGKGILLPKERCLKIDNYFEAK